MKNCVWIAALLVLAQPRLTQGGEPTDNLPTVQILATDGTALAGSSSGAFTLIRTSPTTGELAVAYQMSGTASNGVDYQKLSGTAVIPTGLLATDIVVQPIVDVARRGNKTVLLSLTESDLYQLQGHAKATVTLVDDTFNDLPPTVTLTAPKEGDVFVLPTTIQLTADAADPDGTLKRVSFYANDDFLGSVSNSPYTLSWSNATIGRYSIFARAVDNVGKSTLSAPVQIVVTNARPVVKFTSPVSGQAFPVPANVPIRLDVTDADDQVQKVKIVADGHLLGTVTNSPYELTWTNAPAGKHLLVAIATDAVGLTGSASVSFTVSNQAPQITLVKPTSGQNYQSPATIIFEATASDPDGTIQKVGFYAEGHLLGEVKTSPYQFTWKNVKAGVYTLRAVATDNLGVRAASKTVVVGVSR